MQGLDLGLRVWNSWGLVGVLGHFDNWDSRQGQQSGSTYIWGRTVFKAAISSCNYERSLQPKAPSLCLGLRASDLSWVFGRPGNQEDNTKACRGRVRRRNSPLRGCCGLCTPYILGGSLTEVCINVARAGSKDNMKLEPLDPLPCHVNSPSILLQFCVQQDFWSTRFSECPFCGSENRPLIASTRQRLHVPHGFEGLAPHHHSVHRGQEPLEACLREAGDGMSKTQLGVGW